MLEVVWVVKAFGRLEGLAQKAVLYEVALGLSVHARGGRSGAASVCVWARWSSLECRRAWLRDSAEGLSECLASSKLSHSSSRLGGSFSLTRFLLFGALLEAVAVVVAMINILVISVYGVRGVRVR